MAENWGLVSSVFYVIGGVLFIVGSAYTIPDMMHDCQEPSCTFEVALWYFIGCLAYFVAAVIDLVLQVLVCFRRKDEMRRIWGLRFDAVTESLIAAIVYLMGSILFLIGTVFFFPILNMLETARLVFRAGSFTYIFGSLYGVMQLVSPLCVTEPYRVRRRTMTQLENIIPFTHVETTLHDPEAPSSPGHSAKISLESNSEEDSDEGLSCRTIAVGLCVKFAFICGSTCFVAGGFLFQQKLTMMGGYLWFIGSFFFTIGSTLSIAGLLKERCFRKASFPSAVTVSSTSGNSDRVSPVGLEAEVSSNHSNDGH